MQQGYYEDNYSEGDKLTRLRASELGVYNDVGGAYNYLTCCFAT